MAAVVESRGPMRWRRITWYPTTGASLGGTGSLERGSQNSHPPAGLWSGAGGERPPPNRRVRAAWRWGGPPRR
eukprot:1590651-Prymnesium_polylepis.1